MYHKRLSCDVWFLRYWAWQTEFFVILDHFLLFYNLSNNPKNQNFEKLKKKPGDIIILQKCTKNHDYMLYCSLDMAHNGCNCYFSFLKKWNKHLEILSFYKSVPKIMIICYTVPEIWCMMDVIVIFHFVLFFALLTDQKIKI